MQIRVLGCSGSIAAGSRTTSFLLGDTVLIDAVTGVGDLTLEEMVRFQKRVQALELFEVKNEAILNEEVKLARQWVCKRLASLDQPGTDRTQP